MYNVPFFVIGGIFYLYRDKIKEYVERYKSIVLIICVLFTFLYWWMVDMKTGYMNVVIISFVMGGWLIFAIGCHSNVLHNKLMDYISGISMEIYLCHMMAFRGVEKLHLSQYIQQPDLLYWLTCLLTLAVAIVFSHVVKYKVLPLIEPYIFKQSK